MDQKDLSPEERLLRLIRRGNKKEDKPANVNESRKDSAQAVNIGGPAVSVPVSSENLIFLPPDLITISEVVAINRFKTVETILIAALCLLTAFLIFDISKFDPKKVALGKTFGAGNEGLKLNIPDIKLEPYNSYSNVFSKKSLFAWKEPVITEGAALSENLTKSLANLTLLGVVEGASTQAVIFDKATQKSYFLGVGEFIGEFKILSIESGRVVLEFKDEKVELFL